MEDCTTQAFTEFVRKIAKRLKDFAIFKTKFHDQKAYTDCLDKFISKKHPQEDDQWAKKFFELNLGIKIVT